MSWLRYMTLWSFRKFNPDWKMQLYLSPQTRHEKYWQDKPVQDFCSPIAEDWLPQAKEIAGLELHEWDLPTKELRERMGPSHRSNVFKWELLAERPGIYADTDILFLRSMEPWYLLLAHADTAICYATVPDKPKQRYFLIGLLGSAGNNSCFRELREESIRGFKEAEYQGAGAMAIYRLLSPGQPIKFTLESNLWDSLVNRHPELSYANFAISWVYPWVPGRMRHFWSPDYIEEELPLENIGIHWFAGNRQSQDYNRLLQPANLHRHPCTVTYHLQKVLNA